MLRIAHPTPHTLGLYLGHELQGSYYLDANGEVLPVSANPYHSGWLLAGVHNPQAEFLMIGLGSGAGIVALLTNFPDATCTVVEPSTEVIEAAVTSFKPLAELFNNGRLQLIPKTAEEFLAHTDETWPVILADAYQGKEGYECEVGFLADAVQKGSEIWWNVIGRPRVGMVRYIMDQMEVHTRPIRSAYSLSTGMANYILSTQPFIKTDFTPYRHLTSPLVLEPRSWFRTLSSTNRLALLK